MQSAQQSLQQAGQQMAKGQGQQQGDKGDASEADMGKEFGQKQGQSQGGSATAKNSSDGKGSDKTADKSNSQKNGGGLGNAGIGQGGHVGPQQPLPGIKKDELVRGTVNDKGQKLSRSYKGLPDATKDRAAYYQVVNDNKKAAEASLNKEEIPAGYKDQVKQYFNSIQPGK